MQGDRTPSAQSANGKNLGKAKGNTEKKRRNSLFSSSLGPTSTRF